MRGREHGFQQNQLCPRPLLARLELHADLRGEKALWPAYTGLPAPTLVLSCPDLCPPLQDSIGQLAQASVSVPRELGVAKMASQTRMAPLWQHRAWPSKALRP